MHFNSSLVPFNRSYPGSSSSSSSSLSVTRSDDDVEAQPEVINLLSLYEQAGITRLEEKIDEINKAFLRMWLEGRLKHETRLVLVDDGRRRSIQRVEIVPQSKIKDAPYNMATIDPVANNAFYKPSELPHAKALEQFINEYFADPDAKLTATNLKPGYSDEKFKKDLAELHRLQYEYDTINDIIAHNQDKPERLWVQDISFSALNFNDPYIKRIVDLKLLVFFQGKSTLSTILHAPSVRTIVWEQCRKDHLEGKSLDKYQNAIDIERPKTLVQQAKDQVAQSKRDKDKKAKSEKHDKQIVNDLLIKARDQKNPQLFGYMRLITLARILSQGDKQRTISDLTADECNMSYDAAEQKVKSKIAERQLLLEEEQEKQQKEKSQRRPKKNNEKVVKSADTKKTSETPVGQTKRIEDSFPARGAVIEALGSLGRQRSSTADFTFHPRVTRWLSSNCTSIRSENGYDTLDDVNWTKAVIDHRFPHLDQFVTSKTLSENYTFPALFQPKGSDPIPVQGLFATQVIEQEGKEKPITTFGVVYVATNAQNKIYHAYFEQPNSSRHTLQPEAQEILESCAAAAATQTLSLNNIDFRINGIAEYNLRGDDDAELVINPLAPIAERVRYIFHRITDSFF